LRSFTIGGVEVPRKRVRVAPIEMSYGQKLVTA
jgi:hypothetical protein